MNALPANPAAVLAAAPPTCDLCDQHKADLSGSFRVLPALWRSLGGRAAFHGPVRTVRCHEDNTSVKALLESDGRVDTPWGRVGQVLVVDGGASMRRALVGGNIAAAAARQGWAGVLVEGAVRDVAELAACDVGLLALGVIPLPTDRRVAGVVDEPVYIRGTRIAPGDWLYADADGVVIAPRPLHGP